MNYTLHKIIIIELKNQYNTEQLISALYLQTGKLFNIVNIKVENNKLYVEFVDGENNNIVEDNGIYTVEDDEHWLPDHIRYILSKLNIESE